MNNWPSSEINPRRPHSRPDARDDAAAHADCRAQYLAALAQPRLDTPEGYCRVCGVVRLSRADSDGRCEVCRRMTK